MPARLGDREATVGEPARDVALVIPCFNERARLRPDTFASFAHRHSHVVFVFVDDGSTDGTADVLFDLCRQMPAALRTSVLSRHVGKAEAVRRGMVKALSIPGIRYVGFWDADLATPLDALPAFVAVLDAHPAVRLVMGARVPMLGRRIVRRRLRHCAGRLFASLASFTLSARVYDTQCGAKLFRADAITRCVFEEPFLARWVFDVEILARLMLDWRVLTTHANRDDVYELPLPQWEDIAGSKLTLLDALRALGDLYLIHDRYPRAAHGQP
jgi:dolichyl-phosphate beta-glucosyltransferase